MSIIKSADLTNKLQRKFFTDKIFNKFGKDLSGKTFGIWGLAFKPKTDDMREAPAITIINTLLEAGAKVKAFDPKAMETAKRIFGDKITYAKSSYEVFEGAHAMLLLTEWNEFRRPDFDKIKTLMNSHIVFDGRNLYDADRLKESGFKVYQISRELNI